MVGDLETLIAMIYIMYIHSIRPALRHLLCDLVRCSFMVFLESRASKRRSRLRRVAVRQSAYQTQSLLGSLQFVQPAIYPFPLGLELTRIPDHSGQSRDDAQDPWLLSNPRSAACIPVATISENYQRRTLHHTMIADSLPPVPGTANITDVTIFPDFKDEGTQTETTDHEAPGSLQILLEAIASSGARTEGRLAAAAASMVAAAAPMAAAVEAASEENKRTRNTAAVEAAVAAPVAAAVAAATEGTCATDTFETNADSS